MCKFRSAWTQAVLQGVRSQSSGPALGGLLSLRAAVAMLNFSQSEAERIFINSIPDSSFCRSVKG